MEVVVGCARRNDAVAGLSIDVQVPASIRRVDLVDVGFEVASEQRGVADAAEVRRQHAKVTAVRRSDNKPIPGLVVAGVLGLQRGGDEVEAVGLEAGDSEGAIGGGGEVES